MPASRKGSRRPLLTRAEVVEIIAEARSVTVNDRMARYLRRLVGKTRELEELASWEHPKIAALKQLLQEHWDRLPPVQCPAPPATPRGRTGGPWTQAGNAGETVTWT